MQIENLAFGISLIALGMILLVVYLKLKWEPTNEQSLTDIPMQLRIFRMDLSSCAMCSSLIIIIIGVWIIVATLLG